MVQSSNLLLARLTPWDPSYCLETIQQHSKGHLVRIKGASITKEIPRGFHKGSVSQMLLTLGNLTQS